MLFVIATIYGLLMGNYMTTAYFRIPKGLPLNGIRNQGGKRPHCDVCAHPLKFYEYLPVLSWVCSKFRCNYCGCQIDKTYLGLEVGSTLIAVTFFLLFGMNIFYIKATFVSFAALLNACLFINYRKFYMKAALMLLITALAFAV